ncbi:DJ-1/PfpI family protein [Candidatus Sodalis sp. SoCistrobi]|uniref:DJ-1/PfpI family protein n=1 Tax=Candidatus Sodalis sp. SoCistrobi TaxID=1922216 RepID=UPI00093993C3|nr:DJ-1/PfpI family protein [Candidatus Sodalis sp. SoCistrobi]
MSTSFTLLFALYPGVTQLDFTATHQVFSHWPAAEVHVASLDGAPVSASGLHFNQLEALEAVARCDLLCLPGGPGCTDAMLDARFTAEIRRLAAGAHYVTSVCTGSLILGAAGLLQGRRATCHWSMLESLSLFGAVPRAERVVRDGHVITGAGVTAGIDFALTVVAEVAGERAAQAIQLGLEYAPAPPFDAGHPATAPAAVMRDVSERQAAFRTRRLAQVATAAAALKAR